jgi:hypothetical protein
MGPSVFGNIFLGIFFEIFFKIFFGDIFWTFFRENAEQPASYFNVLSLLHFGPNINIIFSIFFIEFFIETETLIKFIQILMGPSV